MTEHDVVWGLEIGGSAVRLIRVTRSGRSYRADRYSEAPLDDRWNGSPGAAAALGRLGVQRLDEPVVVCLRDELVLHRILSLPDADAAALGDMIAGQLEVMIPTQADQFVSGFHGYDAVNGNGMRSVWVAAAKAEAVTRAADHCRRLGRRAERIVPSLSAVAAIWNHLGDDDGPVLLIDVAAGCTALALSDHGRVLQCGIVDEGVDRWIERVADAAGMTTTDAHEKVRAWATCGESLQGAAAEALRDAIGDWTRHLREVCGHCLAELAGESKPARAILFGRGGAPDDVAQAVTAALGMPSVAAATPGRLDLAGDVTFDRAAPAIGAALCLMTSDAPAVNLLAPQVERVAAPQALKRWAVLVGWLLLATLCLYLQDRGHAGRLEEDLVHLEAQTDRQGGLSRQKAIGDFLESMGPTPLDLMDRLSELLPPKTILASMNHNRTRTGSMLTAAGTIPDAKTMPKLLDDLRVLGKVTGEGRPAKKGFKFEVRIDIDHSVRGLARRALLPSATQPAGVPGAATQPSEEPAGAADSSAAPPPDEATPPEVKPSPPASSDADAGGAETAARMAQEQQVERAKRAAMEAEAAARAAKEAAAGGEGGFDSPVVIPRREGDY